MRLASCVAACVLSSGCVLDFEQFRTAAPADAHPSPDLGADVDARDAAAPDATVPTDVSAPDAPVASDAGDPRCTPPANASVRVAHMAAGFGVVDLCMRRNTGSGTYAAVGSAAWPATGVGYASVSQHVPMNTQVTLPNDRWQFIVVPKGADCTRASAVTALASLNAQIDPQSLSTLLLTAETTTDGRRVGVLGLLSDQTCTSCPPNTLDVRAIHASLAASADRIDLSINYTLPPRDPAGFVNVLFANDIPYGETAPVGGAGFDCDTAWFGAVQLPAGYSVQFGAQAVAGNALARSARWSLKDDLLRQSRMATVFFVGGVDPALQPPQFIVCYEGARDAGMTACDRIGATRVAPPPDAAVDAGDAAADAPADAGDGGSPPADAVDDLI